MAVSNVVHLTNLDIEKGNVLVVSPDGNASAPIKGFSNIAMYTTIKSARNAATSGDTIIVLPGLYDEYDLGKDGVNYYFYPDAIVEPTFNSGKVAIFSDLYLGVPMKINVYGYGQFLNNGRSGDDTSCFVTSYNGSVFNLEAKTIASLEAWNQVGAVINVKNTTITVEAHAYAGGAVTFENCVFDNVVLLGNYWGNNSTFIAKNCTIKRDAINTVYSNAYPGFNQTLRPFSLVYHLPIITGTPFTNVVMELINCDIINDFSGEGLLVPNYDYGGTTGSYLSVMNCRFYSTDLSKGAIRYTDSESYFVSQPSDDTNNTLAFLANNVGNSGIVNVDADFDGSALVNELGITPIHVSVTFKLYY